MDVVFDAQRLRPKKSEVECLIADTKKAERLLGWSAKVGLEEGLQRTIEWISKSLALYKPEIYNI
jgi:nucleoside-diphosphate-sugar epimerase